MKIEVWADGPKVMEWAVSAMPGYIAAKKADEEDERARWQESIAAQNAKADAETPAEPEKPKATRSRKAKDEPAPASEVTEQAQITANPEDRKPVEEIEEAEVVDVFDDTPAAPAKVYTRDDVKNAMQAYVAVHGMDKMQANGPALLGFPKFSAVPEDATICAEIVDRLQAATNG